MRRSWLQLLLSCRHAGTNAKGGTTIERQVAPVLTPGTLLDDGMLEGSYNNFLVAILTHSDENGMWGLAFSDISTGTWICLVLFLYSKLQYFLSVITLQFWVFYHVTYINLCESPKMWWQVHIFKLEFFEHQSTWITRTCELDSKQIP